MLGNILKLANPNSISLIKEVTYLVFPVLRTFRSRQKLTPYCPRLFHYIFHSLFYLFN